MCDPHPQHTSYLNIYVYIYIKVLTVNVLCATLTHGILHLKNKK